MYQICRQFEKKVQWKRPSILIGLHSTSKMSPFLIRPGLRRATFPPGEGIGAAAPEKLFRKPEPLPKIQERMMT